MLTAASLLSRSVLILPTYEYQLYHKGTEQLTKMIPVRVKSARLTTAQAPTEIEWYVAVRSPCYHFTATEKRA